MNHAMSICGLFDLPRGLFPMFSNLLDLISGCEIKTANGVVAVNLGHAKSQKGKSAVVFRSH